MTVYDIRDIAGDQLLNALSRSSSKKEITGVTFSVAFKKSPALETKTVFSFEKDAVIETEEE